MRLNYDASANMAYVRLYEDKDMDVFLASRKILPGVFADAGPVGSIVAESITFEGLLRGDLCLDLDKSGRIVGIELFNARDQLPESIRSAGGGGMRLTYDRGRDVAYVHLVDSGESDVARSTVLRRGSAMKSGNEDEALRGDVVLDLDHCGYILRIQVLGAKDQLLESLLALSTDGEA
jgi:uncharacterized protein YuzE